MNRIDEILIKKKQFLKDGETLIYVNEDIMDAIFYDGEGYSQVSGEINEKLKVFLDWLKDDNKY